MDIERFEELVDEFGEFPAGWPADERAAAISLLNRSPKAREIVAEAAALRSMFQRSEPVTAPAGLANRITMLAADEGKHLAPGSFIASGHLVASKSFWSPAFLNNRSPNYVVLGCCFAVGLGLGLGLGFSPWIGGGQIDFATLFAVIGS